MKINRLAFATASAAAALLAASGASAATVAIVKGDFYTTDLKNQLVAKGNTVTEVSNYTAASLAGYNAVIQYGNDFVDQTALATYVNAGGTLIWTPWAGLNFAVNPELQVFANGGSAVFSASSPGINILSPSSALLAGVTFPAAGSATIGRVAGIGFVAGVQQVASWSDGAAFIGQKAVGRGNVVDINLQALTSDTAYQVVNQPWASTLFNNAVNVTGAVPEPASWAMMILGMGAVGFAMRRRPKVATTVRFA